MKDVYDFFTAALPWLAIGLALAILLAGLSKEKNSASRNNNYGIEGMCVGMVIGSALSMTVIHNNGTGISLGMLIGLALGSLIEKNK